MRIDKGEGGIACLPGVPREMIGVWNEELRPRVIEEFGLRRRYFARQLMVFGIPESELDLRVRGLLSRDDAEGAILVDDAVIRLRWRTLAGDEPEADKVLAPILEQARAELGQLVYAEGEVSLEEATVTLLQAKGLKVAVAESCTGGMISHLLTQVAGASEVLIEGAVTYSDEAKMRRLGVNKATLAAHGAVSEETAREMATGLREQSGADLALAVTGIAGPGGASEEKPIGTVWLALADTDEVRAWRMTVPGDRALVIWRTARTALNTLRLAGLTSAMPARISSWISPP